MVSYGWGNKEASTKAGPMNLSELTELGLNPNILIFITDL